MTLFTFPDYAIEAGAKRAADRSNKFNSSTTHMWDYPDYRAACIASFKEDLNAALAEMVKRGEASFKQKIPVYFSYRDIGEPQPIYFVITLQEPTT